MSNEDLEEHIEVNAMAEKHLADFRHEISTLEQIPDEEISVPEPKRS